MAAPSPIIALTSPIIARPDALRSHPSSVTTLGPGPFANTLQPPPSIFNGAGRNWAACLPEIAEPRGNCTIKASRIQVTVAQRLLHGLVTIECLVPSWPQNCGSAVLSFPELGRVCAGAGSVNCLIICFVHRLLRLPLSCRSTTFTVCRTRAQSIVRRYPLDHV
jgi:hypothetical protein